MNEIKGTATTNEADKTYEEMLRNLGGVGINMPNLENYDQSLYGQGGTFTPQIEYQNLLYKQGLSDAEKTRQYNVGQAEQQYQQYLNPNASYMSGMARSGVSGGYSDYLQGKAYEQMVGAKQSAQQSYADYVRGLGKTYAENVLGIQQQALEYNKAKTQQQTAEYSNYLNNPELITSKESLENIIAQGGYTDEQATTLRNAWTRQQQEAYEPDVSKPLSEIQKETESFDETAKANAVKNWEQSLWNTVISSPQYTDESGVFNEDAMFDDLERQVKSGTVDQSQLDAIKNRYSANVLASYDVTQMEYQNKDGAIKDIEAEKGLTDEAKATLKSQIEQYFAPFVKAEKLWGRLFNPIDQVDINSTNFSVNSFGEFKGSEKEDSEQTQYINKLLEDAKNGKIEEGQFINANYGKVSEKANFVYIGDGKFVKMEEKVSGVPVFVDSKENASKVDGSKAVPLYIPEGYQIKKGYSGRIEKK